MIKITAFKWVPPFAQGLVRDLRPRWALEEAGIAHEIHLIGREDQNMDSYRQLQPFGQVPVFEEDELQLFESGSIVLHIAEKSKVLLPIDQTARARAKTWVFAALNSLEPPLSNLVAIDLFYANEEWAKLRRPGALEMAKLKLSSLAKWMQDREYLENNQFTMGDLMMTTVLRNLRHLDLLEKEYPVLETYKKRCEARPAFKRALDAQMKVFAENAPAT